jgi:hydrophobic/amphiphilic exporter-1 (mainly G- bacteria), HAE1 family
MRLWLDPDRLASRNLTSQDVITAVQQQNLQFGAGQIGQPPAAPGQQYQYSVNAQGRLKDVEEFNGLVVRTTENGALIRLRDVGRAELGAENYGSVLRFTSNDGMEGDSGIRLDFFEGILVQFTRLNVLS